MFRLFVILRCIYAMQTNYVKLFVSANHKEANTIDIYLTNFIIISIKKNIFILHMSFKYIVLHIYYKNDTNIN